jgi:hypothetical protein
MTTSRFSSCQIARYAAPVLALAAHAAMAQETGVDKPCAPQLTHMQGRLYQKASEGPDALRNFIFIRRAMLQVDTYETAIWAASLSQASAACAHEESFRLESSPVQLR